MTPEQAIQTEHALDRIASRLPIHHRTDVAEVRRELRRLRWHERQHELLTDAWPDEGKALVAAVAERDRLREALRQIVEITPGHTARCIAARAALASEPELPPAVDERLRGWEPRDTDGQEPCSIERGTREGGDLEVMVGGLTYEQAEQIEAWLIGASELEQEESA